MSARAGARAAGGNGNGAAPPSAARLATYRDLGSFQLLLSLQDSDALRLFCDSLLGPIENGEGHYGGELMRSLEAFIECNGQWEAAARRLYCHRHTLRYRIRKIEELTGRNLASARDRIEFWLALRGREIVQPDRREVPDDSITRGSAVKVGVPTEIKTDEYRVALTPSGVRELSRARPRGRRAGGARARARRSPTRSTSRRARTIVPDADAVFAQAEMIVKVKEPQPVEVARLRPGQLLFTYLHLAPDPELTAGWSTRGATCVAYETVEDSRGRLPLLAPMSEIAGKIATQAGAFMLEKPLGGRGLLLGGVPGVAAGKVMVIGGGVVGQNAADIARRDGRRGLRLRPQHRPPARARGPAQRPRARPASPRRSRSSSGCRRWTSSIGAVLVKGGKAPHVDHARAARPDEAQRRARRRLDRPGRLLRDLARRRRTPTRPTRSTASRTTASRTCRARCRSRAPGR